MEGKKWLKKGCYENHKNAKGFEDILKNLPVPVSKDCLAACDKLIPKYLFKFRIKKKLFGHCTICKKDVALPAEKEWRHDRPGVCPACGKEIRIMDGGRSRKYLKHSVYFLQYYKGKEPGVITAAGVFYEIDYSGDFRNIKVTLDVFDVFVFQKGKGGTKYTKIYNFGQEHWQKMRFCKSSEMRSSYYGCWTTKYFEDVDGLYKIIDELNLKNACVKEISEACLKNFTDLSHLHLLNMALRYPCLEYLHKTGQHQLIKDKLFRSDTRGIINWQGKTAEQVLKLNKQELNEIKANKIILTINMLKIRKLYLEQNRHITLKKCAEIKEMLRYDFSTLLAFSRRCGRSIVRVNNYLTRQKTYIYDLNDYWNQCADFGMDISDDAICFPKNLNEIHTELSARVKHQQDAILEAKVLKRAEELARRYLFETDDFIMRPFCTAKEIIVEGSALNHCVGGYVKQYADGGTVLCAIRKKSEPDTPFYTVEFNKGGKIAQCRGFKNASATKEVDAFLNNFKNIKKNKGKQAS